MSEEVERLYERARRLDPGARAALVEETCREDPRMRDELLALLGEAEAAEEFFGLLESAVLSTRFPLGRVNEGEDGPPDRPLPPSPLDELPEGAIVGRYRILSFIRSGGMGAVYRAYDTALERHVALKFLPPLSTRLDDEERLLREARSAAALEHPNVCTIHEIGQTDDGRPFIAMALYEGETLKQKLRGGPLSSGEAVQVAIQIARGLEAAHARGILHRDVKPGNVIVGLDGTTRLLDFGLAMVMDGTIAQSKGTPGTVAYMSPEQVRGEQLDVRTDLWSLGVVLYEMLAGYRPFRGESAEALMQSILEDDPEPLAKKANVPAPLAQVVERLLSKDQGLRCGSADEVVADLTRLSGSIPGQVIRPLRRTSLLLAGTAAVLVGIAVALWLPERMDPPAPAAAAASGETSIAVLPLANLSADPRDQALADGMTEELIAMLARTEGLRVIGSTSVFAFAGRGGDVRGIAESLGVSNVLEGGLQKVAGRLRVQVRLLDASDGSTRWAQTYDREFQDVFLVQEEIARAVATELEARLDREGKRRLARHQTPNVAAYELYLRANDPVLPRSDSGVRQSIEYFEQAIAVDSTYAAAYAGLAVAYVRLGSAADPGMLLAERYSRADATARKAVALDDSLAQAHLALGRARMSLLDFPSAKREIERAIALDPKSAVNLLVLSSLHLWAGRSDEALTVARRALEIEPLSPYVHAQVADALFANRRCDEALAQVSRVGSLRPSLRRIAAVSGLCHAEKRQWPEAIGALRPHAGDPLIAAFLSHTLSRAGHREEAERILADLLARRQRTGAGAFEIAIVYAGLGDLDEAFAWLDRSVDDYSLKVQIMAPTFDALHRDPRFERFSRRLGLQNL
ncbi:MAG TPA: protein kinase [Gemmatimonadota bacterium]|nr:protein kinase [Gemmatimonadota bacterium]